MTIRTDRQIETEVGRDWRLVTGGRFQSIGKRWRAGMVKLKRVFRRYHNEEV